MKHACNAKFAGYSFGISVAESEHVLGMFRLICEEDGEEIEDMFETEDEAIDAIFILYPDNDL